jgi:sulfite oxidase
LLCGIDVLDFSGYLQRQRLRNSKEIGGIMCESSEASDVVAGERRPDLPDYRLTEICQHKTQDSRVWVTYGNGVYDITDFMVGHPGGERIALASGGALEPFWELYAVHKSANVYAILETLRIGNVHPEDVAQLETSNSANSNDPFAHEPRRHPALFVHTPKPFNAETPGQLLIDSFITPNELFYVRNHLPVPRNAEGDDRFQLSGIGLKRPITLSVADLKKTFKIHTVTAAMPCAGNRRSDMKGEQSVRGLPWAVGALGNARWTGVLLSDVLRWAGAKEDEVGHVILQGRDKEPEGGSYEASIPAATAFDRNREVLIAFEMNGKPIPPDHGYPLRVIVPGTIGARQVKWLSNIILSKEESKSFWQKKDYKTVSPSTNWDTADLEKVVAIQDFPVQAAICSPLNGTTVDCRRELDLKGYAMSGGGRGILRVELTIDGGKTWHSATIHAEPQPWGRQWSWVLWEATVRLPQKLPAGSLVEIAVKATDTSHNTQPESDAGIWNIRGLLENRWHRIHIQIADDTE